MSQLDSMIAQVLEMSRGLPAVTSLTPVEARERMAARVEVLRGFAPADVETRDVTADGPAGPLPIRVYRAPGGADGLPVLVWLHGGGWVVGDIESHDNVCRHLAARGLLVLSVDYRLAPETRAPGQVEDALAALRWAAANARAHGGDPARLVVGGDSAGGNLATLAAIRASAEGPALAGQLLVYPVTDHPDAAHPSYAENDNYGLSAADMRWFWDHWLGGAAVDASTAPLRAPDLAGLPPAYVLTASHDVLRDEGEAYADALAAAGVPVVRERAPGAIHGFYSMAGMVPLATDALAHTADWVRGLRAADQLR